MKAVIELAAVLVFSRWFNARYSSVVSSKMVPTERMRREIRNVPQMAAATAIHLPNRVHG
jgi:hypothetical protein